MLPVYEPAPTLFACVAVNEAERAAPATTLVNVQTMGASGRIFMAGEAADLARARDRITKVLEGVEGRK